MRTLRTLTILSEHVSRTAKMYAISESVALLQEIFLAQRRKAAKHCRVAEVFFAPLRPLCVKKCILILTILRDQGTATTFL